MRLGTLVRVVKALDRHLVVSSYVDHESSRSSGPTPTWRGGLCPASAPAVPALQQSDPEDFRKAMLAAIDHCRDRRGIYRFRNDHQFVIGRAP